MENNSNILHFFDKNLFRLQASCLNKDVSADEIEAHIDTSKLVNQFNWIWEYSLDGMVIISKEALIIDANKSYCNIFETGKNSVVGKRYVINPRQLHPGRSNSWDGKLYPEIRKIRINGRNKYIKEYFYSIDNSESNDGRQFLIIIRDITPQLKAKQLLRKNKSLISLGRTSALAAHEIKTPLTSIKLNLDLLKKSLINEGAGIRPFKILQQEIDRLERLVKDILLYSRNNEISKSSVNLHILIENIRELMFPLLRMKEIKFINNLPSVSIYGDEKELRSMFLQLIENSIDSVSNGGRIEISSIDTDEHINIYIKDNGREILEADEIFKPFFTTKESGTGLGLAIAKRTVEMHNGTIKLLSSRHGENVFFISFNKTSGADE